MLLRLWRLRQRVLWMVLWVTMCAIGFLHRRQPNKRLALQLLLSG